MSYIFWEDVRKSDEKYKQEHNDAKSVSAEEESAIDLLNLAELNAESDSEIQTLTDDDADAAQPQPPPSKRIAIEKIRKPARNETKPSGWRPRLPANAPGSCSMALPQFTISNNAGDSDTEENAAMELLDDLIEEISPRRKFKTVNVSAVKVNRNDVDSTSNELSNLEKMCESSAQDDGKSVFKCQHCPKAFATAYHLMIHSRKSHVCQHCLQAFEKPTDLYAHIKEKHDKFECLLCGRVFRSNSNLRQHMRNMHAVFLPAHVSLLSLENK